MHPSQINIGIVSRSDYMYFFTTTPNKSTTSALCLQVVLFCQQKLVYFSSLRLELDLGKVFVKRVGQGRVFFSARPLSFSPASLSRASYSLLVKQKDNTTTTPIPIQHSLHVSYSYRSLACIVACDDAQALPRLLKWQCLRAQQHFLHLSTQVIAFPQAPTTAKSILTDICRL